MISVVIPVYREPYLNKTIQSLLDNAGGDVEIIPVFDGEAPDEQLVDDPRVKPVYVEHRGMRAAINAGILVSEGEWIMKTDAHCAFAPGWDTELATSCKPNWLMTPRRYSLDEITWAPNPKRPTIDYNYLSFPGDTTRSAEKYGYSFQCMNSASKNDKAIDDAMTHQGSCWFANREYFMEHIYPLDDVNYGTFAQEQQEIGLKYWLGGGAIKVNKNTWYAHLSKRTHHYDSKKFTMEHKHAEEMVQYNEWATQHWMNNAEPDMVHPFSWLVEKFKPQGWPENWEAMFKNHETI